ncbi:uncharacterized protein LOC124266746 [Haliotis rubra]|uniref:uncharacterized protein LOC124266746 n=1 Tax=Haliotis rubra TaxID=36100 RepID=UPI001EE51409|nr:uncharacterized protein LOC124266746 [Haliotis rubra]
MAASLVCFVALCATYPVSISGISDKNHELPPTLVPDFDSIFGDTDSEMTTRLSALESEMANNDEITKDILRRLAALEARQDEEDKVLEEMERASTARTKPVTEPVPTDAAAAAEQPQEEESPGEPEVAQTAPEVKSRDDVREVTEIPPKQTTSEQKAKAEVQRPEKEIKKAFTAGCGTPPPREGTTVTLTKGTAEYKCKPQHRNIGGKKTRSLCGVISGLWSPVDIFCSNFTTCTMVINNRSVYKGTVSTTKSGYTCQRWDEQTPHTHWFMTNQSFKKTTGVGPETRSAASNYCRDPGVMVSDKTVWCYTTDRGVRSEPCNVPTCQVSE